VSQYDIYEKYLGVPLILILKSNSSLNIVLVLLTENFEGFYLLVFYTQMRQRPYFFFFMKFYSIVFTHAIIRY